MLARDRVASEHADEGLFEIPRLGKLDSFDGVEIVRALHRPLVDGTFIDERSVRHFRDSLSGGEHAQQAVARDLADRRGVEVPLLENGFDFRFRPALATRSMRSCDSESKIS